MEKQEKRNNLLRRILTAENLLLLLLIGFLWMRSCVENFDGVEIPYDAGIHRWPDKLTYVIGEDTALDLTGGVICAHEYDRPDEPSRSCVSFAGKEIDHGEDSFTYTMLEAWEDGELTSDIDFTREGVYTVRILHQDWTELCFPVTVVAPDSPAAPH